MGTYDTIGGYPRHDPAFDKDGFEQCVWLLDGYGYETDDIKNCPDCPVRKYCGEWLYNELSEDPNAVSVKIEELGDRYTVDLDGVTPRQVTKSVLFRLREAIDDILEKDAEVRQTEEFLAEKREQAEAVKDYERLKAEEVGDDD